MEVRGVAPIVDTKASTIDTTFTAELLDKLPTARNAFYDLALTAPGISSVGSDESWLPSPSAFGSAANENIFLVNGVNATNPRGAPWGSLVSVNYNTVEEVKVLALGSKAEYGSFSGAAIDVMTKSGGNDFSGGAAFYSMVGNAADNYTTKFGDDLFFVDPDDDLTTTPEESWEASFAVGGPILRDKLWFYGGYARYGAETDTPLFEPLSTYKANLFDIKLTGELGASHRAWLAYHTEDLDGGQQQLGPDVGRDDALRPAARQRHAAVSVSVGDVGSRSVVVQVPRIQDRGASEHPGRDGAPGFINWWKYTGGQSIGLGGDFPYVEAQKSKRQTLQADYTHYAAEFLGRHEVKFGVQYTKSNGDWQGGYFHGFANFAYPYPYQIDSLAKDWWWNGPESWQWGTDEDPVVPFYNLKTERNPWLTRRQAGSTGLVHRRQLESQRSPDVRHRPPLRPHDREVRRGCGVRDADDAGRHQQSGRAANARGDRQHLRLQDLVAAARVRVDGDQRSARRCCEHTSGGTTRRWAWRACEGSGRTWSRRCRSTGGTC